MAVKLQNRAACSEKFMAEPLASDQKSLCSNCRFATHRPGQTLDEEVVHCQSVTTRGMRVTFKVTSCTSHSDMDQPTYMQLLEDAWILKPASKKAASGLRQAQRA